MQVNNTDQTPHSLRRRISLRQRRFVFFSLVVVTAATGIAEMMQIVAANGLTVASAIIGVLFAVTFTHTTAYFWTGIIGALVKMFCRNPVACVFPLREQADAPLVTRTAVIMPVCNEPATEVISRLKAVHESLARESGSEMFELHLLSDSTEPELAAEEIRRVDAANLEIERRYPNAGPGLIHYRHRSNNTGKKVGNIAEFCQRNPDAFDHIVVLDADSVMTGSTLLRLARLMQAHPNVGIIQTVAQPANQRTMFARVLQFAGRLNSEMIATGNAYWQGGESNYFGHNAILRMRPFIEHCELPLLPGRGALSGPILSHDFVEAAFMRRAGFEVWSLPTGEGSFEEMPSNVIDYARRDRRWCQGNLQHLRLLATPGLHWVSRLHLALGAFSFLVSPLWLCLLVFGLGQIVNQALHTTTSKAFADTYPLFKPWPVFRTEEAMALFALTLAMLLLPRFLALVHTLVDSTRRRTFGGAISVVRGGLIEVLFSLLLAPVLMVYHTVFIMSICLGMQTRWDAQPRGARALRLGETLIGSMVQNSLGVSLLILVLMLVPGHMIWVSPVVASLLLMVPLALISSRTTIGEWLLKKRCLVTPEELIQPLELNINHDDGKLSDA